MKCIRACYINSVYLFTSTEFIKVVKKQMGSMSRTKFLCLLKRAGIAANVGNVFRKR